MKDIIPIQFVQETRFEFDNYYVGMSWFEGEIVSILNYYDEEKEIEVETIIDKEFEFPEFFTIDGFEKLIEAFKEISND